MKLVVQLVNHAQVIVDSQVVSKIAKGYLILVGIEDDDTIEIVERMAEKVVNMRVFNDDNYKMNLSIIDCKGQVLSVSQFTLCAIHNGRRPSFSKAASPSKAKEYYSLFNDFLRKSVKDVQEGIFQAHMKVLLENEGPCTIILDSKALFNK